MAGDVIAFDLLERKAAAFESQIETAAAAPLPGEPEPINPADELAELIVLGVTVASPLLPYLPSIYTPDVCKQLAAAIVPVAEKYGIDVSGVRGGPELTLIMTALPLAAMTFAAHKQWRAEVEKARTLEMDAQNGRVAHGPPAPQTKVEDHGGRLRAA
ncbi:hypothetical protein [Pandoraea norimbergensis]|uniref:Uncharacterized protein n=1 Tax=Pandoraea norimbergensis TaxID=93219 RepID=A0ABM7D6B5_9BURK|nr:hypothetical protein [Pandoraea norimbergensis]ALS61858.1 hypothetical protein AT302_20825 [Pandoraea norimbergensis]